MPSLTTALKLELGEYTTAIQKLHAEQSEEKKKAHLNLYISFSNRVYHKSHIITSIRMLYDKIWKWITSNPFKGNLYEAVNATIHLLFDQVVTRSYRARQRHLVYKIQLIEKAFTLDRNEEIEKEIKNRYFHYLETKFRDVNVSIDGLANYFEIKLKKGVNSRNLKTISNLITQVSLAIFPFWNKMLNYKITFANYLIHYFPKSFPKASLDKPISGAINERRLYEELVREQDWIDIEALLNQQVPLGSLLKICNVNSQIDVRERKSLDKWITGLNSHMTNDIAKMKHTQRVVKMVNNVLSEIATISQIHGQHPVNIGLLINKLDDCGCQLMRVEDLNHCSWFRGLIEGEKLISQGEIYELDHELISNKPLDKKSVARNDNYRVFTVKNHPNLVIKVGRNRFNFLIDSGKYSDYHFGIPCAIGVDRVLETEDGHPFLAIEYLPHSLAKHTWTSTSFQLDRQDELYMSRIESFVLCMYEWGKFPNYISPDDIYLSIDYLLQITKCLVCGPKPGDKDYIGEDNYLAAEEFCYKVAKLQQESANPYILRDLMEVSGYSQHPMAIFYRECVKTMLKTGEFNFLQLSLPRGYSHDAYLKRVRDLFKKAEVIRNKCVESVWEYLQKARKESDQKIQELENAFFKQTIQNIQNWHHFSDKKSLIRDLTNTYIELASIEHRENRKNNLQDLNESKNFLKANLEELYDQILKITVYDRLLDAYLDSSTPSILSDSLIETVLNSFKTPLKDARAVARNVKNEYLDPQKYYQLKRRQTIAKNLYAIEKFGASYQMPI